MALSDKDVLVATAVGMQTMSIMSMMSPRPMNQSRAVSSAVMVSVGVAGLISWATKSPAPVIAAMVATFLYAGMYEFSSVGADIPEQRMTSAIANNGPYSGRVWHE